MRLEGERVDAIAERPERAGESVINGGIYWMDRRILDLIPAGPCSLERDVLPRLAERGALAGRFYDGAFIDIGIPEDLERADNLLPQWLRRPAAFLSRDGVLNPGLGHVRRGDPGWADGAIAAIKLLNDLGYHVFLLANQAGEAQGLDDEQGIHAPHGRLHEELRRNGAHFDNVR